MLHPKLLPLFIRPGDSSTDSDYRLKIQITAPDGAEFTFSRAALKNAVTLLTFLNDGTEIASSLTGNVMREVREMLEEEKCIREGKEWQSDAAVHYPIEDFAYSTRLASNFAHWRHAQAPECFSPRTDENVGHSSSSSSALLSSQPEESSKPIKPSRKPTRNQVPTPKGPPLCATSLIQAGEVYQYLRRVALKLVGSEDEMRLLLEYFAGFQDEFDDVNVDPDGDDAMADQFGKRVGFDTRRHSLAGKRFEQKSEDLGIFLTFYAAVMLQEYQRELMIEKVRDDEFCPGCHEFEPTELVDAIFPPRQTFSWAELGDLITESGIVSGRYQPEGRAGREVSNAAFVRLVASLLVTMGQIEKLADSLLGQEDEEGKPTGAQEPVAPAWRIMRDSAGEKGKQQDQEKAEQEADDSEAGSTARVGGKCRTASRTRSRSRKPVAKAKLEAKSTSRPRAQDRARAKLDLLDGAECEGLLKDILDMAGVDCWFELKKEKMVTE